MTSKSHHHFHLIRFKGLLIKRFVEYTRLFTRGLGWEP